MYVGLKPVVAMYVGARLVVATFRDVGGAPSVQPLFTGDEFTTVSVVDGYTRGTSTGTGFPRLIKMISGLVAGTTYRWTFNARKTHADTLFLRASTDAGLSTGDLNEVQTAASLASSMTFVAPANGVVYVGGVMVNSTAGAYIEFEHAAHSVVAV